ncbi:MAG: helix-turn-helix transcriptional regulator [Lewinellaceae bacterium]|nr:helix-turn-helix transcriptional regulator [Lewinellaceae bacterium]
MIPMKPALEKIIPAFGSSFAVKQYLDPTPELKKPFWHFHPELELVYVKGGSGKRHIGHHLSYFNDGELVFIGSNLPHMGFTDRHSVNESETIIQMRADFLGVNFFHIPEMEAIQQLFERAKSGLSFHGAAKHRIGARIENLPKLDNFERLLHLLSILQEMAYTKEYTLLNASGFVLEVEHQDNDRINVVYNFVEQNFTRTIMLEEVANEANMTVPAFCRYFKKMAGKTFTHFVNEMRVIHACKLLSEKAESITEVCFECGFNNFSHFNRSFKEITGKSPSAYRKTIRKVVV